MTEDTMKCQADCDEHRGKIRAVHVYAPDYDWGTWIYCDEAVSEDRRRGFTVDELTEERDA